MKKAVLFLCIVALLAGNAYAIVGQWLTKGEDAIIEIFEEDDKYYGKIVWLEDDSLLDNKNPDESLRDRSRLGLKIMRNFKKKNEKKWKSGKIYDPENGHTYSCTLKLINDEKLKVRGFIGISILGRTEIWHRVIEESEK